MAHPELSYSLPGQYQGAKEDGAIKSREEDLVFCHRMVDAENALKRIQNGWKRVHTLQLDEQLLVHAEVEPELIQRVLTIAKEVLRRNLALDINKDVGVGRIKIWTSDYQLGQLVSVARL